jgi:CrcB protein
VAPRRAGHGLTSVEPRSVSVDSLRARGRPPSGGRTVDDVLHNLLGRFSVARVRTAAILAGGAAGALARAGAAEALPTRPGAWPWGTFVVNLFGALLLGWLLTRLAERIAPRRYWRFLLGTGFCGAVTTFSTFQVETFDLLRTGHAGIAVAYAVASIVAGMAVAVAGVMLARWGRHW